jgi:hypothetical protein
MSDSFIPDDLAQFILEKIDSVAQLEALLLLRDDANVQWSAQALAKRLYITEKETAELLERLCADGFLVASSGPPLLYHYQPGSQELGQMIDRAAALYSKHLVPVTNLIHSKPKTRVQEFADAFRLRRDK